MNKRRDFFLARCDLQILRMKDPSLLAFSHNLYRCVVIVIIAININITVRIAQVYRTSNKNGCSNYHGISLLSDRLCDLAVSVPGYRSRGPGSIPGATRFSEKQWVWNGVHSAS
jgi:hypothetical protein